MVTKSTVLVNVEGFDSGIKVQRAIRTIIAVTIRSMATAFESQFIFEDLSLLIGLSFMI